MRPLYLAMLGGAAVWLLPAPFAIAMPAGAFGGVLLARAEQKVVADEESTGDILRLAVLALLFSALTVGWLVPLAYQETGRAVSRFQNDRPPVELTEVRPERLRLDELVAGMGSVPGAGQELMRRAVWIVLAFLAPSFAAFLVRIRARWRRREAVAGANEARASDT
jgi:hypothetical protein